MCRFFLFRRFRLRIVTFLTTSRSLTFGFLMAFLATIITGNLTFRLSGLPLSTVSTLRLWTTLTSIHCRASKLSLLLQYNSVPSFMYEHGDSFRRRNCCLRQELGGVDGLYSRTIGFRDQFEYVREEVPLGN